MRVLAQFFSEDGLQWVSDVPGVKNEQRDTGSQEEQGANRFLNRQQREAR
jgi:hypothetical protein